MMGVLVGSGRKLQAPVYIQKLHCCYANVRYANANSALCTEKCCLLEVSGFFASVEVCSLSICVSELDRDWLSY